MIKNLRQKFVLINMSLMSGLVLLLFSVSNYYDHYWNEFDTHRIVKIVAQNGYHASSDEMLVLVSIDADETIHIINNDTDLSNQEIRDISRSLKTQGKKYWKWEHYIYHLIEKSDGSWQLAFTDLTSRDNSLVQNLLIFSFVIIGFFLLFGLSVYLSRFIIKPAQEAVAREKQFVSDASHELKTPVAAIRANAQVLKNQIEPNRYLNHILSETKRMELLVQNLLGLSRLGDHYDKLQVARVNLSEICEEMLLGYESLAYEEGKVIEDNISQGIYMSGNEGQLKQLLAILLDNAIKYSLPKSKVRLGLKTEKKKAVLTISNPSQKYPEDVLEKLFDRFYQAEQSRSRQDSFGLGLALAKSIVNKHMGTIKAYQDQETMTFEVTFKLKK
ncbi:sensor histidine kinase [Streptococcus porci]|uniref:sensor histidine kinase n=1 Tax=Streptococcus porci TaxID=502567 RepID=UPI0004271D16|nr:HAMP domain-containing sensor histidine kinase [Streptococcus porci]